MENQQRQMWGADKHEATVERFYGTGAENFSDYHDGYLNFGLWEPGITTYLEAAENLIKRVGETANLAPGQRQLDVASGMGTQLVCFHKMFGTEIDGMDIVWKHIEHANRRIAEANLSEHIRIHHGTAVKLPFPDATFDTVTCVEGAEHFDTREAFLKEAFRVLKPGGRIALADYTMTRDKHNPWQRLMINTVAKLWCVPKANYETTTSFGERLKQIGFTDVTVREVGALTIPGYHKETRRPENLKRMREIRGWLTTKLTFITDFFLLKSYTSGLIEYVIARGVKP